MSSEESARLTEIEQRLARLEAALGIGAPAVVAERKVSEPPRTEAVPAKVAAPVAPPPRAVTPEPRESRGAGIETAFGLTWLSRIAVLTIVLALAFFFKYAFENHWVPESGRVALGVVAGVAALALGEWFWRGHQRSYGQAVTAAGICFLYLSCWAAFGLYHLVGQQAAFAAMGAITVGAGALAWRYDSAAVAHLGLAGGFATPLLLGSEQGAAFVFGYALLLDLGASFLARMRGWRWAEMLALAGTVVLFLDQMSGAEASRGVFTGFVAACYVIFAASAFLPVFASAQVLAGLALVDLWAPQPGVLAAILGIAGAGLAVADRRRWATAVSVTFASFWLAYGVWQAKAGLQGIGPAMAALTLSYGLFLAWPVWKAVGRVQPLRFQELALIAVNAAFYFGAGYGLLQSGYAAYAGLFAVAVAMVQMGVARWLWMRDARGSLLSAAAAWVLLVLAAPIQFAGYRITIAWAVEAAALTWIGVRLRNQRVTGAALLVFVLVGVRLAALDSLLYANPADYGLLANARFLTFAIAAGSLWAAAWWTREGSLALAPYLAGHFVMLWGLCLEAAGWALRGTAASDARSAVSLAISVLVAAYAVLLVAGGVAQRSAVTRVAGIVLMGLVVLKLYLYDVWLLGQFYRMTAFAILGVLLLAISYLYSRFRGSIESWWRT